MDDDFPAAQGTDAHWFAVDRDGRVGWFETHEDGIVPEEAALAEDIAVMVSSRLDGRDYEEREDPYYFIEDRLKFGYYAFTSVGVPVPGFYEQSDVPESPLHVDQLPPAVRRAVEACRFEFISFAEVTRFHPGESKAFWGWQPAYLCGDGKTVRPLPGREGEYEQYCQEVREYYPEESARLEFEGLDEGPP